MRNEQGTENPSMSVGAEGLHFLCFREEKKRGIRISTYFREYALELYSPCTTTPSS